MRTLGGGGGGGGGAIAPSAPPAPPPLISIMSVAMNVMLIALTSVHVHVDLCS